MPPGWLHVVLFALSVPLLLLTIYAYQVAQIALDCVKNWAKNFISMELLAGAVYLLGAGFFWGESLRCAGFLFGDWARLGWIEMILWIVVLLLAYLVSPLIYAGAAFGHGVAKHGFKY